MFNFSLNAADARRIGWTALFAFLAVFGPLATGFNQFHNYGEVKAAVLALIPTALAAAFSAIKNGFLSDKSAIK